MAISGRRNADGTGGTGAALRHFEETGTSAAPLSGPVSLFLVSLARAGRKYPLVVKLGTITPAGADVYSYAPDENDMASFPPSPRAAACSQG